MRKTLLHIINEEVKQYLAERKSFNEVIDKFEKRNGGQINWDTMYQWIHNNEISLKVFQQVLDYYGV